MTQTTNNPVILMLKPDSILVQEIKVLPAKAKVTAVRATRARTRTHTRRLQPRLVIQNMCVEKIYLAILSVLIDFIATSRI